MGVRGQKGSPGGPRAGHLWCFAPKPPEPWQVPHPRAGLSPAPPSAPGSLHKSVKENLGSPKFSGQKFIPREEKKAEQNSKAPGRGFSQAGAR